MLMLADPEDGRKEQDTASGVTGLEDCIRRCRTAPSPLSSIGPALDLLHCSTNPPFTDFKTPALRAFGCPTTPQPVHNFQYDLPDAGLWTAPTSQPSTASTALTLQDLLTKRVQTVDADDSADAGRRGTTTRKGLAAYHHY